MTDDEIKVFSVSSVRTCTVAGDRRTVVLVITSGSDTRHYSLDVDDFVGLTKQMKADAHLLLGEGAGRG